MKRQHAFVGSPYVAANPQMCCHESKAATQPVVAIERRVGAGLLVLSSHGSEGKGEDKGSQEALFNRGLQKLAPSDIFLSVGLDAQSSFTGARQLTLK